MTGQPSLFQGAAPEFVPPPPAPTLDERVDAFVSANPWIVDALAKLARDYVGRGHSKVGIGHLVEVLRWSYAMQTSDPHSTFRINNSYRSRLARIVMQRYPDLDGVFETRELKAA